MGVLIILAIIGIIALIYSAAFPKSYGFSRRRYARPNPKFQNSKLVSVLLGLDDDALKELLDLYKKEFGRGAARYARKTYRKWKTGEVRPVTQTYERFLVHLPKVMSFDLKCDILRAFMEEYAAKDNYALKVSTEDWEEKLTPMVEQIIDKAYTAQLPVEVERKLRWLGQNDIQSAQKILRRSQVEEARITVSLLREEFANIEKLLKETHLKPKVKHELKFPYGTITLDIKSKK
jgi:hypothetical protein